MALVVAIIYVKKFNTNNKGSLINSTATLRLINGLSMWRHVQAVSRGGPVRGEEVSDPVDSAYITRILS
jgi:hypothetical protein